MFKKYLCTRCNTELNDGAFRKSKNGARFSAYNYCISETMSAAQKKRHIKAARKKAAALKKEMGATNMGPLLPPTPDVTEVVKSYDALFDELYQRIDKDEAFIGLLKMWMRKMSAAEHPEQIKVLYQSAVRMTEALDPSHEPLDYPHG